MHSTPATATDLARPRRIGGTAGWFNVLGAAVALLSTAPSWSAPTAGTAVVGVCAAVAALCGLVTVRWGSRMPRWCFHAMTVEATALLCVGTTAAPQPASALVVAAMSVFLAVNHAFFWPRRTAVVRTAAVLALVSAALLVRGVHPGPVAALAVVVLGVVLVIGQYLHRRSSSSVDALTGLPSRLGFDAALDRCLLAAGRRGEPVAVLLLDVDHFKRLNDQKGHEHGDRALVTLAAELVEVLRHTSGTSGRAALARLGGDEFAVVAPGLDDQAVLALASRLRRAAVPLDLSAGAALWCAGEDSPALVRRAEAALHRAKTTGRGNAQLAPADDLQLVADLAAAIAGDAVQVVLQPLVDPADGRLVGVEALARWHHPERGPVPPDVFVELAEEHGMVVDLGQRVLRRAIAEATALRDAVGRDLLLSVNASGRELVHPQFVPQLVEVLAQTRWSPAHLVVEVTESVVDADSAEAREALEDLRWCGVGVAIDDFGTGYSCLSRMDDLPADYLKLDSGFIAEISSSPQRRALLRGLVAMSREIGLVVIAEGIETADQALLVSEVGCPLGQGFHFHRPAPAADLVRRFRTDRQRGEVHADR